MTPLENFSDTMPPRRSVATPVSQPIGNVIAAAPTREIKLPPFEEDMPQAWYNQAEAYFRLHGVTDRMFWFYYVQWALTPVQKKLARDLLSIPDPPPNAYELLKERLLRLYDKGEKDRCRRLLSMLPLGGRRPSELLAEMLQLDHVCKLFGEKKYFNPIFCRFYVSVSLARCGSDVGDVLSRRIFWRLCQSWRRTQTPIQR